MRLCVIFVTLANGDVGGAALRYKLDPYNLLVIADAVLIDADGFPRGQLG